MHFRDPKTKLGSLADTALKFEWEMAHKQWLNSILALRVLVPLARPAFWMALFLALAINVLLLSFYYSIPVYVHMHFRCKALFVHLCYVSG